MRATSSASPTTVPPTNAISDSSTVQRAASSRLRRMSHNEKSTMDVALPSATEQQPRTGPVQQPAQGHREQQVQQHRDESGLERAEVARVDQARGVRELGR